MKKTLLLLLLITTGKLLAAPYITIGDLKFFKAYAPVDSPVQLREYLPAGETLTRWKRLASVQVFQDRKDPVVFLNTMASNLIKDPSARVQLLQAGKAKTLVLDFLVFSTGNAKPFFAEWDLLRAKYVKGQGLVLYQYAVRYYTAVENLSAAVITERNKMFTPFVNASFMEKEDGAGKP